MEQGKFTYDGIIIKENMEQKHFTERTSNFNFNYEHSNMKKENIGT